MMFGKVWMCIGLLFILPLNAQDNDILNKELYIPKLKGSTYEVLKKISDLSGYLFMYDSEVVNNERNIKIPAGDYSLKDIILQVTDFEIQIKVIDRHILLHKSSDQNQHTERNKSHLILEGIVKDKENNEPIPYCSVNISENGMGTVTNQNGAFILKLPDSLKNTSVRISHIGYESQNIPADLFMDHTIDIYLNAQAIALESVIINYIDPQKILKDMMENRSRNYPSRPFYTTSFYREGINRKKGFCSLSEGVFRIYKTGYNSTSKEQVKLMKMRKISDARKQDTVIMKMKAGVSAILMLDVVKDIPDFLEIDGNMFDYRKTGIETMNEHRTHVITFEQKPEIRGPLYKGSLYIDEKSYALIHTHFQINPAYIEQANSLLVANKGRNVNISVQSAEYSVSYRLWNSKYYINHIRGDLHFKVKLKKIFSVPSLIHTYFEMVTCAIDTLNVKKIPFKEVQPAHKVFSETHYVYDAGFWENFNMILPEEKLSDAISRITSKIEEKIEF
ncbi:MAG: carboxypeptidase-like regulatory domain-containing protein [Bacteroidales bacterium]|jgi:hypothetical protein|nr:carboxypeptidase-like regulatory domain-containing protein [Bacteroidales bacterium]